VLVVDDDAAVREVVVALLQREGRHAVGVPDGRAALAQLRLAPGGCALILLDLRMPEMNGWQFRAAQREVPELAAIPVVVVSADAGTDDGLDAAAWLAKPVDPADLFALVARYP
jgi:CheY-like chemotaxis protein